ncbi:MAG: 30S ribosomal protein S12 methylthiotransferase RimO [Deltaproteobacteria bacterium]|nr:30S ribosomal protein S12 methylthiotransferase RimO [Deltaproteobacteria bacterium]
MAHSKKRIFLLSLGCSKNLVDSENILGILSALDYSVAEDISGADIGIINTCGFLQSAAEEAISAILEMIEIKKRGGLEKVIVTGCLVQRYGYKLKREIPEVDGWLGTGELNRIAELIESTSSSAPFFITRPEFIADHELPRLQTTPFYSAYIKIAEGCFHRCTYCVIPAIRGPLRSRPVESIVMEAKAMQERGVKEINLIAQDTTVYGADLGMDQGIERVLEKLIPIQGIEWIRILYSHPNEIRDSLLQLMEREEKIAPYLDIPLQHVNLNILKAMGREAKEETPCELIERVRSYKRGFSIRTTMMVGFPGETEEAFQELYDFVERAKFDHLGTFIYSPEPGTRAAKMKGLPGKRVSKKRRDSIMRLQSRISLKKNRGMVNKIIPVLVEGLSKETDLLLSGRSIRMAPDVDTQVLINSGEGLVGEIQDVLITEAHPYDLVGEIV